MVFLDEFGDYIDGQNDSFKEGLRKSDGVPTAAYAVSRAGRFSCSTGWRNGSMGGKSASRTYRPPIRRAA